MGRHYVGQEARKYLYLATYHVLPTDQADKPSDIPSHIYRAMKDGFSEIKTLLHDRNSGETHVASLNLETSEER